jgi:hypothetical protein
MNTSESASSALSWESNEATCGTRQPRDNIPPAEELLQNKLQQVLRTRVRSTFIAPRDDGFPGWS